MTQAISNTYIGLAIALVLFAADQWLNACEILGKIRLYCADVLKAQGKLVIPTDRFDFLWVVDFPMFAWNEEEQKWDAEHHPFTMPKMEALPKFDTNPGEVYSEAYDMVCNGYELASGSIRNQHPDLMVKAFELTGLTQADVEERFGDEPGFIAAVSGRPDRSWRSAA